MTMTDVDLARWESLVSRLEALVPGAPVPLGGVDPDGFPSHVAAGELIESAWGNAVVDKLRAMQPATPPYYVAAGGNDALPTGLTNITWPTVTGTAFTYDSANKRLVCVQAGQYVLSAFVLANAGTVADVRIGVGGGTPMTYVAPTTGGAGTIAVVRTLNVNDAVQVQVNNPGAATTTAAGGTRFEAARVKL